MALVALATRVRHLEALESLIESLQVRIRELEAQLRSNSTNSSHPPSSDPPSTARPRKKSGRQRGGQKGHPGDQRALYPPERLDEVVEHRPAACQCSGHSLAGAPLVGVPTRHQVIELPRVRAHVSEHRAFTLAYPRCRDHTRALLPTAVRTLTSGDYVLALVMDPSSQELEPATIPARFTSPA